jgi:hypothetical protein
VVHLLIGKGRERAGLATTAYHVDFLSKVAQSQAKHCCCATFGNLVQDAFRNVPFRNDYTRAAAAPVPASIVDVVTVSLDSPLAFWPGLRMSIPPLK